MATPRKRSELVTGAEVAVWLAKSTSRGSRYGAGNRAAPHAGGSGCWVRATVHRWHAGGNRWRLSLILQDGRQIHLPPLGFLQVGELDLRAPDPRTS